MLGYSPTENKLLEAIARQARYLTNTNRVITLSVIYDAVKLIYCRQKEFRKPTLKPKEIALCIELVYFHRLRSKEFMVKDRLAENFGTITEKEALEYYEKKVMGICVDRLGDPVEIDELGMDFLYQDHDLNKPYLEYRGKRLPWIQHTISTSREIYTSDEEGYEQFYYVNSYVIPLSMGKTDHCYFVVIIRKRRDKSLGFLTAFPVIKYNQLLSKMARWRPVNLRDGKKLS